MPWQIFIVFASVVAAGEEMPPNISIGKEQWQTNRTDRITIIQVPCFLSGIKRREKLIQPQIVSKNLV